MTVLLNTTFTGSNGSPWPSPWATALVGGSTGGAIDIQSNMGRLRTHDGAYNTARASATGIVGSDYIVEGTITFPSVSEQYCFVYIRTSGGWSSSSPWRVTQGYKFYIGMGYGRDEIVIEKVIDAQKNSLPNASIQMPQPFQANVSYSIKFSAVGTLFRAKMWRTADSEPPWQISVEDSSIATGGINTSILSGGSSGARELRWDTFTVTSLESTDPEDPITISSDWTNYIARSTVGSPEQPNNRQFFIYNGTELVPVDMYVGGP